MTRWERYARAEYRKACEPAPQPIAQVTRHVATQVSLLICQEALASLVANGEAGIDDQGNYFLRER